MPSTLSAVLLALLVATSTVTAVIGIDWQINLWPLAPGASASLGSPSNVAPAQAGDILIVNPIGSGPVFAVNLTSKTLLWGVSFDGIQQISAVPASNTVVITAQDFTFGYDLTTGKQLWVSDLLQASSAPIVHNGNLIFANQAPEGSNSAILSGVTAINARTGRVVYNAFNGTFLDGLIALSADKGGFVNTAANAFVVFDLPSGGQIWSVNAAASFVASGEDHVVIANTSASGDRELVILDANTGKVLSRAHNASGAGTNAGTAKIQNGILYVVLFNGAVNAIDLRTGLTKWMLPVGAGTDGAIEVVFTAAQIVALNFTAEAGGPTALTIGRLSDGASLSQTMVPTNAAGSLVIQNGKIILPNLQGLLEFSLATGQLVYRNENLPQYGSTALSVINGEIVAITATSIEGLSF